MLKPIIIMPEDHWDALAKQALLEALPMLNRLGYDTLCMEQPWDSTQEEIVAAITEAEKANTKMLNHLEKLLKSKGGIFNSLLDYDYDTLEHYVKGNSQAKSLEEIAQLNEVIYSIIELPGTRMSLKLAQKIIALQGQFRGVDVVKEKFKVFGNHSELAVSRKPKIIEASKEREECHVNNLLQLQREGRGVIFFVGKQHLENELLKFQELECLSEVIVIYPYSLIDKCQDKTKASKPRELVFNNPRLKQKLHILEKALVDSSDLADFVLRLEKLVNPVVENFYKPIPNHAAANILSATFDIYFSAQQRPSLFVDCVHKVSEQENPDKTLTALLDAGIYARITAIKEQKYLCVPEVNAKSVSAKIIALNLPQKLREQGGRTDRVELRNQPSSELHKYNNNVAIKSLGLFSPPSVMYEVSQEILALQRVGK